jgi:hypothetical protein
MIRNAGRISFAVALGAALLATPADAEPKITSKLLVAFYKQQCVENIKGLKARLTTEKVKIAGSKSPAASSEELTCAFDAANPTIRKLNDKAWVAETDAFIRKQGLEVYARGAMKTMAINIAGSGIDKLLAEAKSKGLTKQQLQLIGQMTRAMAFTEAHVMAAQKAYGK